MLKWQCLELLLSQPPSISHSLSSDTFCSLQPRTRFFQGSQWLFQPSKLKITSVCLQPAQLLLVFCCWYFFLFWYSSSQDQNGRLTHSVQDKTLERPQKTTSKSIAGHRGKYINKILHLESEKIQHGTTNYLSAPPKLLLDVAMPVWIFKNKTWRRCMFHQQTY